MALAAEHWAGEGKVSQHASMMQNISSVGFSRVVCVGCIMPAYGDGGGVMLGVSVMIAMLSNHVRPATRSTRCTLA